MCRAGLDRILTDEGIEWIDIFAVDNVLQRICDPCFVGATVLADVSVGAKVVRKAAPDEKVGVMCLEDGRPSIVEYYELSEDMMNAKDEKGEPAYNFGVILNYLFRVKELAGVTDDKMPLHVVKKKIPYIDENAQYIKPSEPNGYKFEQLVLDMIHLMDSCLSYEIDRDHGAWLMNCLRREIEEEVEIDDFGTLTLRGLINDNGNDVGSVHLGFFFTLTTTGNVSVRETEKLEGGFEPIASLPEQLDAMETWSQIVTPELISLWTAGKI